MLSFAGERDARGACALTWGEWGALSGPRAGAQALLIPRWAVGEARVPGTGGVIAAGRGVLAEGLLFGSALGLEGGLAPGWGSLAALCDRLGAAPPAGELTLGMSGEAGAAPPQGSQDAAPRVWGWPVHWAFGMLLRGRTLPSLQFPWLAAAPPLSKLFAFSASCRHPAQLLHPGSSGRSEGSGGRGLQGETLRF